jgi:KUP system potassium uptake protein
VFVPALKERLGVAALLDRPGARPVRRRTGAQAALALGALGVVFGDIGTSPLYAVEAVFNPADPHPVAETKASIYGVISMIFWSVTIVVTLKYVLLVMRADNQGEGGIMALITLIRQGEIPGGRRTKLALAALGIFGASLFFGDSMITPAISVLSAVEGLKVVEPSLGGLVVPITAAIVLALFASQRYGTAAVGRLFGPIMVVWFLVIGACGISGVAVHPQVLEALSPTYALSFLFGHFGTAFFSLAAVVLAFTGAEALYADLGHFGRLPITASWLGLVFPALILNYMGQGALLFDHGSSASGSFFLLVPAWGRVPMIFLATVATVIASQAVITGAYSVAHQAMQLGYLPRLRVVYTSAKTMGQIYVPWINWLLAAAVLALVLAFRTSASLAFAYGMAVTGTITITTLLFFYIVRRRWGKPLWLVLPAAAAFLAFDLLFLSANLTKLTHGAWFPLLVGLAIFTVLTTWQRGRELVSERRERQEGRLRTFVEELHRRGQPLRRSPGTAVFLNRSKETTPLAMRAIVEHSQTLHERVVILSLETLPVPSVEASERYAVDDLGYRNDGISHLTARFGYMEQPDVPAALRDAAAGPLGFAVDEDEVSYFLSTIELRQGVGHGLSRWRKRLFLASSHVASDAADYFGLPRERTVIMGSLIAV